MGGGCGGWAALCGRGDLWFQQGISVCGGLVGRVLPPLPGRCFIIMLDRWLTPPANLRYAFGIVGVVVAGRAKAMESNFRYAFGLVGVVGAGRAAAIESNLRQAFGLVRSEGGLGEGYALWCCVIMRAVAPGIARRHPGLLTGRPYGTGLVWRVISGSLSR